MRKILIFTLILAIAASVTAASYTLADYPNPFVESGVFNTKIVVGQNAATSDVIGAVDVAAGLIAEAETDFALNRMDSLFGTGIGILDVDAPELGEENLIVVGGPCANSVAAELMDYPSPCNADFQAGKAFIKYYPEKKALLIAGYEAQETLVASYVVADHSDYELKGNEIVVTIAEQGILSIQHN